jgi:hypothetical protein
MERHFKNVFGRQLRKQFTVPDDLPYPMRKALEALGKTESERTDLSAAGDDDDSTHSSTSRMARDHD